MCDEWMPSLTLALTAAEFRRLPRHAAYRYEYIDGHALLSPWPRTYHACLDLTTTPSACAAERVSLRAVRAEEHAELTELFATAFAQRQPFGSLETSERRSAAAACLRRTFDGGDGPWVADASFAAVDSEAGRLVGVILITLLPGGDPSDRASYGWSSPPPPALWEQSAGQPHLTWIFVSPFVKGVGVGTALLRAAAAVLRRRGYRTLWTTFLAGNDASMLWHWRNGFTLCTRTTARRASHEPGAPAPEQ